MSTADAAVVTQFLNAVQRLDIEGAIACLHPDVRVDEPLSLPYGGVHDGLAGFMTIFTTLAEKVSVGMSRFTVLDAGSSLVGVIDLKLAAHGTGAQLELPVIELYTVSEGRIAHIDVYPKDTQAMAAFLTDAE